MPPRRVNKALTKTQQRKKEHLEICLDSERVTGASRTGFDRYYFVHNALPELDIEEIDLSTTFLGKPLRAPILISSMTGGFDLADDADDDDVERVLARLREAIEARNADVRTADPRLSISAGARWK